MRDLTRRARRVEEELEGWTFATWQETTRWWLLLHEEARGLILTMPRAAE